MWEDLIKLKDSSEYVCKYTKYHEEISISYYPTHAKVAFC